MTIGGRFKPSETGSALLWGSALVWGSGVLHNGDVSKKRYRERIEKISYCKIYTLFTEPSTREQDRKEFKI